VGIALCVVQAYWLGFGQGNLVQVPIPGMPGSGLSFMGHETTARVVAFLVVFLGINGLICLGAVRMLQLRNYGLVMLAAILAVVNFYMCVILVSYPAGAVVILTLRKADVKQAFT
jgi:hypothetical protein